MATRRRPHPRRRGVAATFPSCQIDFDATVIRAHNRQNFMAKGTNSMSSEKSINSETLESLRSEYSQLTALFGNYFMMPYNVIPLAVTICGALTL